MASGGMRRESPDEPTHASLRVFYALWPDAPAARALDALARRNAAEAGGRAAPLRNLHVTLAFVGMVRDADVDRLVAIGTEVARQTAPFGVTLDRIGSFREQGIVWLGTRQAPAPLQVMTAALKAALGGAGFAVDARPFRVHVTLARRCQTTPMPERHASIAWAVAAFTLTASTLGAGGPRYRDLARFELPRAMP